MSNTPKNTPETKHISQHIKELDGAIPQAELDRMRDAVKTTLSPEELSSVKADPQRIVTVGGVTVKLEDMTKEQVNQKIAELKEFAANTAQLLSELEEHKNHI